MSNICHELSLSRRYQKDFENLPTLALQTGQNRCALRMNSLSPTGAEFWKVFDYSSFCRFFFLFRCGWGWLCWCVIFASTLQLCPPASVLPLVTVTATVTSARRPTLATDHDSCPILPFPLLRISSRGVFLLLLLISLISCFKTKESDIDPETPCFLFSQPSLTISSLYLSVLSLEHTQRRSRARDTKATSSSSLACPHSLFWNQKATESSSS